MAGKKFGQRLMAGLEAFERKLEEYSEKLEKKFPKSFAIYHEVSNPASLEAKYNDKTKKLSGVIYESLLAKGFVFITQIGSTVGAYKLMSNGPMILKLKKDTRDMDEKNEALLGDISRCQMRLRLYLKQSAADNAGVVVNPKGEMKGTMVYSSAKGLGAAIGLFMDRSAIASVLYPTEYFLNAKMKRELKKKLEEILESERESPRSHEQ